MHICCETVEKRSCLIHEAQPAGRQVNWATTEIQHGVSRSKPSISHFSTVGLLAFEKVQNEMSCSIHYVQEHELELSSLETRIPLEERVVFADEPIVVPNRPPLIFENSRAP